MQVCAKCGKFLKHDTPRQVIDGKVYDLHCGWNLEQAAIRRISDTLNIAATPKDESGAQPLHWVSQQ